MYKEYLMTTDHPEHASQWFGEEQELLDAIKKFKEDHYTSQILFAGKVKVEMVYSERTGSLLYV